MFRRLEHLAPYHVNVTIEMNVQTIDINAYDLNQHDNITHQFPQDHVNHPYHKSHS